MCRVHVPLLDLGVCVIPVRFMRLLLFRGLVRAQVGHVVDGGALIYRRRLDSFMDVCVRLPFVGGIRLLPDAGFGIFGSLLLREDETVSGGRSRLRGVHMDGRHRIHLLRWRRL